MPRQSWQFWLSKTFTSNVLMSFEGKSRFFPILWVFPQIFFKIKAAPTLSFCPEGKNRVFSQLSFREKVDKKPAVLAPQSHSPTFLKSSIWCKCVNWLKFSSWRVPHRKPRLAGDGRPVLPRKWGHQGRTRAAHYLWQPQRPDHCQHQRCYPALYNQDSPSDTCEINISFHQSKIIIQENPVHWAGVP